MDQGKQIAIRLRLTSTAGEIGSRRGSKKRGADVSIH